MQTPPTRLNVIFQLLTTMPNIVDIAHRNSPYPPRNTSDDGVFWVHSIGEEPTEITQEFVRVKPTGSEQFDISQPITQRQRRLSNRVSPSLGDVVTGYGDEVVVSDVVFDVEFGHITHHS